MRRKDHIALIYFSRTPYAESEYKQWFKEDRSGHANKALATSLVTQSARTVRQSGFPIFHYHEGNQTGSTFGEKITNAFAEVFEQGYRAVIAVGNDSPGLERTDWDRIAQWLDHGENVLGPSTHGGTYLVGLTAATFKKLPFQRLPWQTQGLFEALFQFCCDGNVRTHTLDQLHDVNSFSDLITLVKSKALSRAFKRVLLYILGRVKVWCSTPETLAYPLFNKFTRPLRAPPTFTALPS